MPPRSGAGRKTRVRSSSKKTAGNGLPSAKYRSGAAGSRSVGSLGGASFTGGSAFGSSPTRESNLGSGRPLGVGPRPDGGPSGPLEPWCGTNGSPGPGRKPPGPGGNLPGIPGSMLGGATGAHFGTGWVQFAALWPRPPVSVAGTALRALSTRASLNGLAVVTTRTGTAENSSEGSVGQKTVTRSISLTGTPTSDSSGTSAFSSRAIISRTGLRASTVFRSDTRTVTNPNAVLGTTSRPDSFGGSAAAADQAA